MCERDQKLVGTLPSYFLDSGLDNSVQCLSVSVSVGSKTCGEKLRGMIQPSLLMTTNGRNFLYITDRNSMGLVDSHLSFLLFTF